MSTHGTFGWNELLTSDVEKAKAFYASTLGWTYESMAMPEGGAYWVASIGGIPCAGIMSMKGILPDGTPPFWFPYINVDNVDARLKLIVAGGGKVMREPWDIPGVGRIGIFSDATGSGFGLMTPVPRH